MTDPAGVFPSNTHRRVLGHLSYPDDSYGWTADQLVARMRPDASTWFETAAQIEPFLQDLAGVGDAWLGPHGWQMTAQGLAKLKAPAVTTVPEGPAIIQTEPEQPRRRRWWRND